MRKYKTGCFICGRETRNTRTGIKPIDVCSICVKVADKEKEVKEDKMTEEENKCGVKRDIYGNITVALEGNGKKK
ncbi:hypothetical protein LCGC14_0374140 [marine sediment metagenome]|uniref:Uncharacterized protein n=1 Tax=marine sediment metagenome TaxID=412755 RepID=A0A0F9T9Z2_9ZZZZ